MAALAPLPAGNPKVADFFPTFPTVPPNPAGDLVSTNMSQRMPTDSSGPQAHGSQEPNQSAQAALELTWVLAAKSGDRQAFGKLAQAYQRQCAAVAVRLLGNSHDAAELVQDALLKAYRCLEQLQQAERFGPWLMRIVTNLALNFRRSRVRRQAVSLEQTASGGGDGEDLRSSIAGSIQDLPEKPLTSAELGSAIQQAIDNLPEKQRLALVMFAIEKMPQKDVADVLECSVEAVKWHVFTARKQLRKTLGQYF
jgi:RNA polymerase sigma-70 factor (ECF subfamily)